MSKRIILNLTLIFILLVSWFCCTSQKVTKELHGTWVVENFILPEGEMLWIQLKVNMITFNKDGACKLPVRDLSKSDTAIWRYKKEESRHFIIIESAQDSIFNRKFQMTFSERTQGDAVIKVLTLSSIWLMIKCSK